ncbi:MAG: hypothetical protein HYW24_02285 [Candidatus Aenigmarchaeota archaeon]|nr:hypothetical protein [Candidatus Aenigmarchaeota archaeon]
MKIAKTAPDALKVLWEDKFFVTYRSQKETEGELTKREYNFGDALRKALVGSKFLLVTGSKGERRFIQKYPYVIEEKPDE